MARGVYAFIRRDEQISCTWSEDGGDWKLQDAACLLGTVVGWLQIILSKVPESTPTSILDIAVVCSEICGRVLVPGMWWGASLGVACSHLLTIRYLQ